MRPRHGSDFTGFVVVYAVAALAWLPLRAAHRCRSASRSPSPSSLRALLLFHEPFLSGDVYRYLSDGRVSRERRQSVRVHAGDPRGSIIRRSARSIRRTRSCCSALVHDLTAWRLLLIAADLAAIVLLRRHGALAYATCPLVLFEGVGSAHIDSLAGVCWRSR